MLKIGTYILLTSLFVCLISSSLLAQTTIEVKDKFGQTLLVKMKDNNKKRIYNINAPLKRYGMTPDKITKDNVASIGKRIIKDYEDILEIKTENLNATQIMKGQNYKWYLNYQQVYKNIPVWRTYVGMTLESKGVVNTIGSKIYTEIDIDVSPAISEEEALSLAIEDFSVSTVDSIILKSEPELFIYPENVYNKTISHLAFKINLISTGPVKNIVYFVDGHSGEIIESINNVRNYNINGTVRAQYFPEHYYDTPVNYQEIEHVYIKIENYLGQKMKDGYTNSSGYYSLTWYGGYSLHTLSGKKTLSLNNNYVSIRQAHQKTHEICFYPSGNTSHSWGWATDETNVYYHVNEIHDYFTGSPFNYSTMDYQVKAYVHDEDPNGNPYNGWSDGTNIGFGHQGEYQWAKSSDVVYHEYTHCVVNHLYGGRWIGYSNASNGYAMDEGFADYYAATNNNHSRLGESVGLPAYRNLNNNKTMDDYVYDDNDNETPYKNAPIVAGSVWDMRQTASIGVSLADELLFNALKRTPHAYEFDDLLDNILYEDDNDSYVSNGTPHLDDILYAFENHKIIHQIYMFRHLSQKIFQVVGIMEIRKQDIHVWNGMKILNPI